MTQLDAIETRKDLDETLDLEPYDLDRECKEICDDEIDWHSEKCINMMNQQSKPCILKQVSAARQRQKNLKMRSLLTDCARNPMEANGLRFLDGMATGSCIYEAESVLFSWFQSGG